MPFLLLLWLLLKLVCATAHVLIGTVRVDSFHLTYPIFFTVAAVIRGTSPQYLTVVGMRLQMAAACLARNVGAHMLHQYEHLQWTTYSFGIFSRAEPHPIV